MENLIAVLKGKKTYIVAILTIMYALSGLATGNLSWPAAIMLILPFAGGLSTIRAAISKLEIAYAQHQATINAVLDTVQALPTQAP